MDTCELWRWPIYPENSENWFKFNYCMVFRLTLLASPLFCSLTQHYSSLCYSGHSIRLNWLNLNSIQIGPVTAEKSGKKIHFPHSRSINEKSAYGFVRVDWRSSLRFDFGRKFDCYQLVDMNIQIFIFISIVKLMHSHWIHSTNWNSTATSWMWAVASYAVRF